MRIKTSLGPEQLQGALSDVQSTGLVGQDMELADLELTGITRTGMREIRAHISAPRKARTLDGKLRRPLSGCYGGSGRWAATHDEWGWWLALLFERDPDMRAGRYAGRSKFHHLTQSRFIDVIAQMDMTQRAIQAGIAAMRDFAAEQDETAIRYARNGGIGWGSGLESGPIGFRERVSA